MLNEHARRHIVGGRANLESSRMTAMVSERIQRRIESLLDQAEEAANVEDWGTSATRAKESGYFSGFTPGRNRTFAHGLGNQRSIH